MVKLKALGIDKLDEKGALLRQGFLLADCRQIVLSEKVRDALEGAPVAADDRCEAILLPCFFDLLLQGCNVVRMFCEGADFWCNARALDGVCLQLLFLWKEGRLQGKFCHLLSRARKERMDLLEGDVVVPDRLELIAKEHELCVHKVLCKRHELGLCVVLHLIDHDVGSIAVALAGQRHLQVEPLNGGDVALFQKPLGDVLDVEPAKTPCHAEGTAKVVLDLVFVLCILCRVIRQVILRLILLLSSLFEHSPDLILEFILCHLDEAHTGL